MSEALREALPWLVEPLSWLFLFAPFIALAFVSACFSGWAKARGIIATFALGLGVLCYFYIDQHYWAQEALQQERWTASALAVGLVPFFIGIPVFLVQSCFKELPPPSIPGSGEEPPFDRSNLRRTEPSSRCRIAASMRLSIVPIILLLGACATQQNPALFEAEYPPAGVQLATAPGTSAPGGVVDLSLQNGAARPVGYNLCIAALEQLEAGLWVPARSHAVSCPQSFASLGAGATATGQAALPASLAPGLYRFVTQLSASSESLPDVQLRGEPFRVD